LLTTSFLQYGSLHFGANVLFLGFQTHTTMTTVVGETLSGEATRENEVSKKW